MAPPAAELGPAWFEGARLNFAENLLRRRDDAPALVNALGRVLDDRALHDRLGAAGREHSMQYSWPAVTDQIVGVYCSADAIIPMRAYMLVASYLQPVAKDVVFGDEKKLISTVLLKNLQTVKAEEYTDKRVVVKGCGDVDIPETAYVEITNKLRPFAKSIMYGEPCSTVPIYKKR